MRLCLQQAAGKRVTRAPAQGEETHLVEPCPATATAEAPLERHSNTQIASATDAKAHRARLVRPIVLGSLRSRAFVACTERMGLLHSRKSQNQ